MNRFRHRISSVIASLILLTCIIGELQPIRAQTLPPCGQDQANGLTDGDIDHYDLVCFTSIPESYITTARNKHLLFVDRSVGANIDTGLECLGSGAAFNANNNNCGSGLTTETFISDTKYSRANWKFAHYGDGGWWDSVSNYINNTGLRESVNGALVPFTPDYNSFEAMNFQFSYLSVMEGSNIAGTTGYFAAFPGSANVRDVHDMEAFEAGRPNTDFFHATTSLARTIGGSISYNFNNSMRTHTQQNNIPLIDFADIGSHNPQGQACSDGQYPNLCVDYTSEPIGGHLSNAMSRQRPAKAMWLMMASLSGWSPGSTPPPTATPTQPGTATPTPSRTPTPTRTPTPSPTTSAPSPTPIPVPGDATGEGDVNLQDYNIILSNFGRTSTSPIPRNQGDLDGNRSVDLQDFNQVVSNFGN